MFGLDSPGSHLQQTLIKPCILVPCQWQMSKIPCFWGTRQSRHAHRDARHNAAQRHADVEASQVPPTAWTTADLLIYSVWQVFTSKCWLKLGTAFCPEEDVAVHLDSLVQQMVTATVVVCSMVRCFQSLRLLLCLAESLFMNIHFWEIYLEGGKYGTDNCGHQKKGA